MDSKRDFERNKLKDLELVLSNKEKENDALKEQINKTKSDSQSDLETEHLKCVNIEKENWHSQPRSCDTEELRISTEIRDAEKGWALWDIKGSVKYHI